MHTCDVDEAALRALAEADPEVTRSTTDVADRRQVAGLFDDALQALGGLDCLVNNAGIAGPTGRVEDLDPAEWDRCLAVDITGGFNCTRLAVPHLKQSRNGSIVNISSAAGKFGFPLRTPYAAAKWAVIGFTKSLAMELGEFGIRANAVLPGVVAGERQDRVLERQGRGARHLLRRAEAQRSRPGLDQGDDRAAAPRRHDRLSRLPGRAHHLGPGDRGRWRPAVAGGVIVIPGQAKAEPGVTSARASPGQ